VLGLGLAVIAIVVVLRVGSGRELRRLTRKYERLGSADEPRR
jgi:hypothetical protein